MYRVDGEVGRFSFNTHEVVVDEKVVFKSADMFPAQRGKAYYQTQGFREVGMFLGATGASYRKTCEWMNRLRRQESEGTPLNTLRDATESEGKRILDFWAAKTDTVLEAWGVNEEHPPTVELCGNPKQIARRSQAGRVEVRKASVAAEIPEALHDEVASNPVPYERPDESVNICSDGVLTKKQREKRRRPGIPVESAGNDDKTTKRLNHKTATIEHHGKRYTLVAATYVSLFRTILAFVLNNGFQCLRLCFFSEVGRGAWHFDLQHQEKGELVKWGTLTELKRGREFPQLCSALGAPGAW